MTSSSPSYLEDRISQIPALRRLMAMGWQELGKRLNAVEMN